MLFRRPSAAALLLFVAGCGGSPNLLPNTTFTVGGTVTGLDGTLVLQLNGAAELTITGNGPFVFPTRLAPSSLYSVTVRSAPADQICTVSNGSGLLLSADVRNIAVACVDSFAVGGTATGVTAPVVLRNNGGDDLTVTADGPFVFPIRIADGGTYAVTVHTAPANLQCTISGGTGTVAGADVTAVALTCIPVYSIGGTVSGLDGTMVLRNNGGDDLTITANGGFVFPTRLPNGATYAVTVLLPPVNQQVTISMGAGTIAGSDVGNVGVDCVDTYTIGGTVTGLSGTLVLQNNGSDDLTITANGPFVFPTRVPDAGSYAVTVRQGPPDQSCTVGSGSGTVAGGHVTTVAVTCADRTWRHPANLTANISPDGQAALEPRVAVAAGRGIVVWFQNDATRTQIFKSELVNNAWTHPASLSDNISPDGQHANDARAALAANGDAVVAWRQNDGANEQIFRSHRRNGVWTHPAGLTDNVSPDGDNADQPEVAVDGAGSVLLAWHGFDGSFQQVFKSEYRGGSWTDPANRLDNFSPNGQSAVDVHVAANASGVMVAVWRQNDGLVEQIFKSEYRGGAWSHPSSLADNISPNGQSAFDPRVAVDAAGNAVVVWRQSDGSSSQIFKSEYRGGAWTHPSSLADNISPNGQDAFEPAVAMDAAGSAIVTWRQSDGSSSQIFKSEYRSGSWTHPSSLADNISPNGQNAFQPQVAMDANGSALVVWRQLDGSTFQAFVSEYRSGAWTHPSSLADNISPNSQSVFDPQVAMDDDGSAVIVWRQSDGANAQIFMSEFR